MAKRANLVFPHQLFEDSPLFGFEGVYFLIEEERFFKKYNYHKQKLAFHRASMKKYAKFLKSKGFEVEYIDSGDPIAEINELIKWLSSNSCKHITYIDPTDISLEALIARSSDTLGLKSKKLQSKLFLAGEIDPDGFFRSDKSKFYQTSFYKSQRKQLNILLENGDEPTGGKWSFDAENREKYPKGKKPPKVVFPGADAYYKEAVSYVKKNFSENPGELGYAPIYPFDFQGADNWLSQFLSERFEEFGPYEDAIVRGEPILNHSVLSPLINVGLITVREVVDRALEYSEEKELPLNSTEGFIRQVIGWREFIRGVYEAKGEFERSNNFWGFKRRIPRSFYEGTTGIDPVDETIKGVLATGYCHHIERLMILGNFMLLCEFDPEEVFRWFMEMFIDAYDWVMVPNVYGMSQFADGGLMSTKPYISSSNYILKMSDYPKGDWQDVWDGLFWRFMDEQREFFESNPRMGMLLSTLDKMDPEMRKTHFENAQNYLDNLDK